MQIIFDKCDIEKLCTEKEFSVKISLGTICLHRFSYGRGSIRFLLDVPLKKDMACQLENVLIDGGELHCTFTIESTFVQTLMNFAHKFVSFSDAGLEIDYPNIRFDLNRLDTPVVPKTIEFYPDEIKITGELK